MGRLLKTKLESILVFSFFAATFLILDRTDFFVKKFPSSFEPIKSAAQIHEGELYGTCAPIEQLQDLNFRIAPVLQQLKHTPFFRTYKINLERECPFWAQQRLCNNGKCSVCECDEKEVPTFWNEQPAKSDNIITSHDKFATSFTDNIFSSFSQPQEQKKVIDCPQNDKEWCVDDQEGTYEQVVEADYMLVNLLDNEETYTAYIGGPVWNTIYQENCLLDKAFTGLKQRANQDRFDYLDHAESCTEETLLYHMMSGLHASVNTHISEGFEDPQNVGELINNQTYFLEHVGNYPERVKNLHFVYAAVVKAVTMMEKPLVQNDYETGIEAGYDDLTAKRLILSLIKRVVSNEDCDEPFREKNFFAGKEADLAELELLSEMQHKFYNISRIMDCISCDKCRLNGKVQVRGLATTLKVLFMPDSKKSELMKQISNQEIVSVIQLLIKLSESITILDKNSQAEKEFGLQVFMCQMIATFATSTLLTTLGMLICGFASDNDDGESPAAAVQDITKEQNKVTSAPNKNKGKKSKRDKID